VKKLLVVFLLVVSAFATDWSGKVDWAMTYNQAKMISEQTGKPIFVDFALSQSETALAISSTASPARSHVPSLVESASFVPSNCSIKSLSSACTNLLAA
jgi:hypothetical protein